MRTGVTRPTARPLAFRLKSAGLLTASLLFWGCASDTGPVVTDASPMFGEKTFNEGFEFISSHYYRAVDFRQLALAGLGGLSKVDPGVAVEAAGSNLVLKAGGTSAGTIRMPRTDDAQGWAAATGAAIAQLRTASAPLKDAEAEDIYKAVFDGMMRQLDPNSRYTTATRGAAERAERNGYGGIGVTLDDEGGRFRVGGLIENGPAARAGVRTGEMIAAIDGESTKGLPTATVRDRLRGRPGSIVLLTLDSDGKVRQVQVQREQIIPPTTAMRVEDGIAIISISRFNAGTESEVRNRVAAARRQAGDRLRGYVLDLRGNPGGYLDQAVHVADAFVTGGDLLFTRGRHPKSGSHWTAKQDDIGEGLPMVVLVDKGSASAAEILAAALQDRGRAVVVGSVSYGKGSVQNIRTLQTGGEIILTWSRIFAPSGYTFHQQGIMPQVCTSRDGVDEASLTAEIREGRYQLPATLASWRRAAPEDATALAQLRETCPWKEHDPALDLRVAKRIILDTPLYQRALALTVPGTVASR